MSLENDVTKGFLDSCSSYVSMEIKEKKGY